MNGIASWWSWWDAAVAACLAPAAIAILISGLDDLALDAVCLWAWLKRRWSKTGPESRFASGQPEKLTAIFVPLWHEHAVIGGMVEHNVAAINYDNYHFFIGAYPNDDPTLDAVRELEIALPARSSGRLPARRPHLQGRLPELDLPAHAAVRGAPRRSFRHRGHARRRGSDSPRGARPHQRLLRAITTWCRFPCCRFPRPSRASSTASTATNSPSGSSRTCPRASSWAALFRPMAWAPGSRARRSKSSPPPSTT